MNSPVPNIRRSACVVLWVLVHAKELVDIGVFEASHKPTEDGVKTIAQLDAMGWKPTDDEIDWCITFLRTTKVLRPRSCATH